MQFTPQSKYNKLYGKLSKFDILLLVIYNLFNVFGYDKIFSN